MKLISLNIEGSRHLDLVLPFLKAEAPDVICLQEFLQKDFSLFEKELGMRGTYEGLLLWDMDKPGDYQLWGLGILSRFPMTHRNAEYYFGAPNIVKKHDTAIQSNVNRAVLGATIPHPEGNFHIANTHFPNSSIGDVVTDFQRTTLEKLLSVLEDMPEFVLCGDLNAPRGLEIFDRLAAQYKDNIPPEYTSSIGSFHRAGPLPYVVDGLFTTPHYQVESVRLVDGLSDHKAVVAEITRVVP